MEHLFVKHGLIVTDADVPVSLSPSCPVYLNEISLCLGHGSQSKMAYAKKVYYRRNRSSRYRRRARRRRYRYRKYRRYYRRSRRQRVEYKRLEFGQKYSFNTSHVTSGGKTYFHVEPFFYDFFCIGVEPVNGFLEKERRANIIIGGGVSNRIGAKIRPVSLRLFGTMSIYSEDQVIPSDGLANVNNVNNCMLRMIVFQVRNANNETNFMSQNFSAVNPFGAKTIVLNNETLNVANYNGEIATYYIPSTWFSRIFSVTSPITSNATKANNAATILEGVLPADREKFGVYAKCPYRAGIGTYLKILKDKLYHFNPTTHPSFAFRTKVKRPYRMVWTEDQTQENGLNGSCKNPIYICFIPIFPTGVNQSKIEINMQGQMFYTDK